MIIKNSVIGENVEIGEGAKIIDSAVGDDEKIEANAEIINLRVWNKPVPEGYPDKQVGNVIENQ